MAAAPAVWLTTVMFPVAASYRKMSWSSAPSVWPAARLNAWLANAIHAPSALIEGDQL